MTIKKKQTGSKATKSTSKIIKESYELTAKANKKKKQDETPFKEDIELSMEDKERELTAIVEGIEKIDIEVKDLNNKKKVLRKRLVSTIKAPSSQLKIKFF